MCERSGCAVCPPGTGPGRAGKSSGPAGVCRDMSTPIHGYERYERAKAFFAEAEYLAAARELEDFFTDVAAARAEPRILGHLLLKLGDTELLVPLVRRRVPPRVVLALRRLVRLGAQ